MVLIVFAGSQHFGHFSTLFVGVNNRNPCQLPNFQLFFFLVGMAGNHLSEPFTFVSVHVTESFLFIVANWNTIVSRVPT
jgi:hypothetical protein